MRYLGIDLAWGEGNGAKAANETGVVAMDDSGLIVDAGWTVGIDQTVGWIERWALADTLLFVDAPLVVDNADGMREAERQVGQRYGRWWVSANASNTGSADKAGITLRERLQNAGWRYDDGWSGPPASGRVFSECYPYTTIVGVEELQYDKRPAYKRLVKAVPREEARAIRARECDELISRLATLAGHAVPLDLRSHERTRALVEIASPAVDKAYKHREDLLDAAICAWTAALWHREGNSRCQVLGVMPTSPDASPAATIIAPARPGPPQRPDPKANQKSRSRAPKRPYREIEMPRVFDLECLTAAGEWIHHGYCEAAWFTREADGSYVASNGGSALLLRCLRQDGNVVYVVDGGGDPYTYRIVRRDT